MNFDLINRLRADFREMAMWHEARSIWSKAETLEIGRDISATINADDEERLALWCAWIAEQLEFIRRLRASAAERCRRFEARVRASKGSAQ